MKNFTIDYGQASQLNTTSEQIDFLCLLEQIDYKKKNPYLVVDRKNSNYIQTLRSPQGFIVECRYFFHQDQQMKDWKTFIHYRAWSYLEKNNPGIADPKSGEFGPRIHEQDYLTIYQAASLLTQYINTTDEIKLPEEANIHWRDVTEEFPSTSSI